MGHSKRLKDRLEFGGPAGTSVLVFGLPAAVLGINIACNKVECTVFQLPTLPDWTDLFDYHAALMYIGWCVFQLFLSILPTGKVVYGLPLKSGHRLDYRCNGFAAFIISIVAFLLLAYLGYPLNVVYQKFLALAVTSILFSFVMSTFLYLKSFSAIQDDLVESGNSGIAVYDFFLGRELNPRIGPVDLKFFCELRPGLIGWVLLDIGCVAECMARNPGQLPNITLLIVTAFHTLYVADALWHEDAILTTMDIVRDGFGFMLVFGDLSWVPFLYCLQARYLLEHPQHWSLLALLSIVILNFCGFIIFRGSNSQKNEFRKNPNIAQLQHLKTLTTRTGKKLLISGWWGWSRHPNYMGDLIMALSWSLLTGWECILPYFYPLYFLGLLIHRSHRDDAHCRQKYGTDWNKYCSLVPYRIFPYIY
jgi:lamin-B receptor